MGNTERPCLFLRGFHRFIAASHPVLMRHMAFQTAAIILLSYLQLNMAAEYSSVPDLPRKPPLRLVDTDFPFNIPKDLPMELVKPGPLISYGSTAGCETSVEAVLKATGRTRFLQLLSASKLGQQVLDGSAYATILAPSDFGMTLLGITADRLKNDSSTAETLASYHIIRGVQDFSLIDTADNTEWWSTALSNANCRTAFSTVTVYSQAAEGKTYLVRSAENTARVASSPYAACNSVVYLLDTALQPCCTSIFEQLSQFSLVKIQPSYFDGYKQQAPPENNDGANRRIFEEQMVDLILFMTYKNSTRTALWPSSQAWGGFRLKDHLPNTDLSDIKTRVAAMKLLALYSLSFRSTLLPKDNPQADGRAPASTITFSPALNNVTNGTTWSCSSTVTVTAPALVTPVVVSAEAVLPKEIDPSIDLAAADAAKKAAEAAAAAAATAAEARAAAAAAVAKAAAAIAAEVAAAAEQPQADSGAPELVDNSEQPPPATASSPIGPTTNASEPALNATSSTSPAASPSSSTAAAGPTATAAPAPATVVKIGQQCGGLNCPAGRVCGDAAWASAVCVSGTTCTRNNAWHWSCQPKAAEPSAKHKRKLLTSTMKPKTSSGGGASQQLKNKEDKECALFAAAGANPGASAAAEETTVHTSPAGSSSSSSRLEQLMGWAASGLGLSSGAALKRRRQLHATSSGSSKNVKMLQVYETCENMRVLITDAIVVPCNFEELVGKAADIEAGIAKRYGRKSSKYRQSLSSAFWEWLVKNGYITVPDISNAPLPPGSATQAAAFFTNYGQEKTNGMAAVGPQGLLLSVMAAAAVAGAGFVL